MTTHLVPPHGHHPRYRHWCHKHQYSVRKSPLFNRSCPQGLSLMSLLLQVCPLQPHNCHCHRHFQGCTKYQALLLIAQGHVLHHRDTIHLQSPLGPAKVPPSPNQYDRQQDCGFECSMGFPQQASTHRHDILCQRPTSQPKLAYAQEATAIAIHSNANHIWPENPVYTRQGHIGPPVTRMPQTASKKYWVPTVLCMSCR
jgi:hypothetical protein